MIDGQSKHVFPTLKSCQFLMKTKMVRLNLNFQEDGGSKAKTKPEETRAYNEP